MNRAELQKRVDARKQELAAEKDKLTDFSEKVTKFVNGVKKKSTIYALVKNLSVWKELEKLLGK